MNAATRIVLKAISTIMNVIAEELEAILDRFRK